MIARAATSDDILHVCRHMRAHNRREMLATRFHDDPDLVAGEIMQLATRQLVLDAYCCDDGEPACLIGLWLLAPGLALITIVMTDRWGEIALAAAYRFKERQAEIFAPLRRVQCVVMASGDRRWLSRFGFVEEGPARAYGKGGEDFVHVAWTNPWWRGAPDAALTRDDGATRGEKGQP